VNVFIDVSGLKTITPSTTKKKTKPEPLTAKKKVTRILSVII